MSLPPGGERGWHSVQLPGGGAARVRVLRNGKDAERRTSNEIPTRRARVERSAGTTRARRRR